MACFEACLPGDLPDGEQTRQDASKRGAAREPCRRELG
jgi:hypothetical protein